MYLHRDLNGIQTKGDGKSSNYFNPNLIVLNKHDQP